MSPYTSDRIIVHATEFKEMIFNAIASAIQGGSGSQLV